MPRQKEIFHRLVDLGNFSSLAATARDFYIVPTIDNVYTYVNAVLGTTIAVPQYTDIVDNYKLYKIINVKLTFIPHVNFNAAVGTSSVDSMGLVLTSLSELDPTDYGQTEDAIEADYTAKMRDWSKPIYEEYKPLVALPVFKTGANEYILDVVTDQVDLREALGACYMSPWLPTYLSGLVNSVEYSGYHFFMDTTTNNTDLSYRVLCKLTIAAKYPN